MIFNIFFSAIYIDNYITINIINIFNKSNTSTIWYLFNIKNNKTKTVLIIQSNNINNIYNIYNEIINFIYSIIIIKRLSIKIFTRVTSINKEKYINYF